MKCVRLVVALVVCCSVFAEASESTYLDHPSVRQAILRDAGLTGPQAAALVISDAQSTHGYGSIVWNSGHGGGVYIYKISTGNDFPYNHVERLKVIGKYDRMPDPCSLRKVGVNPVAAFFITGEEEPGLCEPAVITEGMHAMFSLALGKARWSQKEIAAREITIVGNYALVELDRDRNLHPGIDRFSQGFRLTSNGWDFANFGSSLCSMADAKVPWSVASKFLNASARIAYESEEEEVVPHGAHCVDEYQSRLKQR